MWQNGMVTADASYRFDPSTEWQPLTNLRRLLDSRPNQPVASTQPTQSKNFTLSIIALVLAFIPLICIGGVVCGHIALKRARADNDAAARVISIIALVIGYLSIIHTAMIFLGGAVVLFKSYQEPPDFSR